MVLTKNDEATLLALFNSKGLDSPPPCAPTTAPAASPLPGFGANEFQRLQQSEQDAISKLNIAVPFIKDIIETIVKLTRLIESHPNYAPAYLDRAQALRLQLDAVADQILSDTDPSSLVSMIFSDLSTCIKLLTPDPSTTAQALSQRQRSLLAKAYTHRGYLYLRLARLSASWTTILPSPSLASGISSMSKDQLEELASADLAMGGKYGNKLAEKAGVATNPYAKMCGAIVRGMMEKEREEYAAGQCATQGV